MSEPKCLSEILPGLAGDVQKLRTPRKAKKPAARATLTAAQEKDIKAQLAFQEQEYGTESLAYMPSQLVQCSFPHDDPGDVAAWGRSTPWLGVIFQPGYKTDKKTGKPVCVGYPYGTIPRLLMFYVMTEIQRKKNRSDISEVEKRKVYLGDSLGAFMRNIGLNPDNGTGKRSDKRRLRDQVERFCRVKITFDGSMVKGEHRGERGRNAEFVDDWEFWWTAQEETQSDLFQSFIELDQKFYNRVMQNMVPLDVAALRALKNSALHLDLYAWFLYRSHTLRKGGTGEARTVEWRSFMMQSGASYKHVRQFRAKVIEALAAVRPYLKHLRIEADEKGITVHPPRFGIVPSREN